MSDRGASELQNPWDVIPNNASGDRNGNAIYLAVGQALTSRERLDEVRALIFGQLVASRSGAAERAYGTITSFAGRAAMVVAASDRILADDPKLMADLQQLMTEIDKLSGRRNDVAHGVCMEFMRSENGAPENSEGHFLVPASYNTRKQTEPTRTLKSIYDNYSPREYHKYAYTADQIAVYTSHFIKYRAKAWTMLFRIKAHCERK